MATKTYRIEFWQLSMSPTASYPNLQSVFQAVAKLRKPFACSMSTGAREIRGVEVSKSGKAFRGYIVKLQHDGLPYKGKLGGSETKLDLEDDEGLLEKNFFHFSTKNNLLMWQSNRNGSGAAAFCATLNQFATCKIGLSVVATHTAAKRLLSGEGTIKKYRLNIARPTHADLYPKNRKLTDEVAAILANCGGDRITVESSIDTRLKKNSVGIKDSTRDALAALAKYPGTQTARVTTIADDGEIDVIDLMTDRIGSNQSVELDGRYPNADSMYDAFAKAHRECAAALAQVFGDGPNKLD